MSDSALTNKGKLVIKKRALECAEVLLDERENEALVDSSMILAKGITWDGRIYQLQMKITFDEYDFCQTNMGEVEL